MTQHPPGRGDDDATDLATDPVDPYEAARRAQKRRRRWRAFRHSLVLVLVVGLVGGVGVVAGGAMLGRWELPWAPTPTPAPSAESTAPVAAPPPPPCEPALITGAEPPATTVRVLNATATEGLAGGMQAELQARGFVVSDIGNSGTAVPEPALVRFPAAAEAQAIAVAANIQGAVLQLDDSADVVTLTLGDAYAGVRPPEEAAVIVATPVPSLLGCPVVPAARPADPVVEPVAPAPPG